MSQYIWNMGYEGTAVKEEFAGWEVGVGVYKSLKLHCYGCILFTIAFWLSYVYQFNQAVFPFWNIFLNRTFIGDIWRNIVFDNTLQMCIHNRWSHFIELFYRTDLILDMLAHNTCFF